MLEEEIFFLSIENSGERRGLPWWRHPKAQPPNAPRKTRENSPTHNTIVHPKGPFAAACQGAAPKGLLARVAIEAFYFKNISLYIYIIFLTRVCLNDCALYIIPRKAMVPLGISPSRMRTLWECLDGPCFCLCVCMYACPCLCVCVCVWVSMSAEFQTSWKVSYKVVKSVWCSLETVCKCWLEAEETLEERPLVLGSLWSFFHFILRFWNQILICLSERHKVWAISIRRRLVKYRLKWNSFSSSRTCCLV